MPRRDKQTNSAMLRNTNRRGSHIPRSPQRNKHWRSQTIQTKMKHQQHLWPKKVALTNVIDNISKPAIKQGHSKSLKQCQCNWGHKMLIDADWMLNVQMFKCSNVPRFQCSNVPMFKCSNIQMLKCSNAQMSKCSKAQMFKWSDVWMFKWSNVKMFKFSNDSNVQMLNIKCQ